ncbi:hypothetical protein FQZ97_869330 [compost metagenome]
MRPDLLGLDALLRKLQVSVHLAEQGHFGHERETVVSKADAPLDLRIVGIQQRHFQLEAHPPVAGSPGLFQGAVQQGPQGRIRRQRQVRRHRSGRFPIEQQFGVFLHVGNGGGNGPQRHGLARAHMRHRAARAVQRQADLVDAETAGQVLQHRPALAVPPRRRVVDLGAGIRARNDELALRGGIGVGEIVQVALERDGGGLHLAGRQAGCQPFARIRVDLQRQVAVDRGHGAADHRAAHVDAARRRLAFALPLALQAHVDVVVGQVQLGDVHEPVFRIRPLDAGV